MKTCSVSDCGSRLVARGYCSKHYRRFMKWGDPLCAGWINPPTCSVEGCDKPTDRRAMCSMHYSRAKRHGSLEKPSRPRPVNGGRCSVGDCPHPAKSRGMCGSHYAKFRRTGEPGHWWSYVPRNSGGALHCFTCEQGKPSEDFYDNPRRAGYKITRCKACVASASRKSALQRRYGLTEDEVAAMTSSQGGCGICGDAEARLVVDHDHSTGAVRELLCDRCNTTLGRVLDDASLLESMIEYLKRHAH